MSRKLRQVGLTKLGELIRDWMYYANRPPITTIRDAAQALDVDERTLQAYFSGKRAQPSVRILSRISQRTGIALTALYDAAGIPVPPPSAPSQQLPRLDGVDLYAYLIQRIKNNPTLSAASKEANIQQLIAVRDGTELPAERHIIAEHVVDGEVSRELPAIAAAPDASKDSQDSKEVQRAEHAERT